MAEKTARAKQFVRNFMDNLERLEKFIEEKLPNTKLKAIEVRLNELNSSWEHYKKCIPPYEKYDDSPEALTDLETIEELYYTIRPELEEKIQELRESASVSAEVNKVKISQPTIPFKLPEISLDTFAGDYMKWANFISSFDSIIHDNPKLTDIVKFQYLKRALVGQAAQVIEALEFNAANYLVARNLLKERFDKHNYICEQHIASLHQFQALDKPCPIRLLQLIDHYNAHLRALESLGRPVNRWDDLIVYIISTKLDPETKSKWIDNAPTTHLPTIEDLLVFLRNRAHKLESKTTDTVQTNPTKTQSDRPKRFTTTSSLTAATTTYFCTNCQKSGHTITRCRKFFNLPVNKRLSFVNTSKLCHNCLRSDHDTSTCSSTFRCRHCNSMHHTLLHNQTIAPEPSSSSPTLPASACTSSAHHSQPSFVYLATAKVKVFNRDGQSIIGRALLDSGSQLNFVTDDFFSKLKLPKVQSQTVVQGIGSNKMSANSSANIQITSTTTMFSKLLNVKILDKITSYNTSHAVSNISSWPIPANLRLADPEFYSASNIDLLIGADTYFQLMSIGQIQLGDDLPTLQHTLLGWIVSGRCITKEALEPICHLASEESDSLSELIIKFWTIENISYPKGPFSSEETQCEEHFIKNTHRNNSGRFVVNLPFSVDPSSLGDSKDQAVRRILSLERRLHKNPQLFSTYAKFMEEYETLGHMTRVPPAEIMSPNYVFPHHCVIRPDSSTTKLRVVFDGSAKTTNGKSLNSILMVGPVVQNDLFSILVRFRAHRYAFSADITKMYRQIFVHANDRQFQYILWRTNPDDDLQTYRLNTVTYGTASAPYLATRCLKQLALDNHSTVPDASEVIQKDVYVDDLLTGSNSIQDATNLKKNIEKILISAGMELRKWCSNSNEIISTIPIDHREKFLQIDDTDHVKTLGILWQPRQDVFSFSVRLDLSKRVTKRTIFSQLASIYDPLGLLNPVVVVGKLMIQTLWKLKLDWDQALPQQMHSDWLQFRDRLPHLNKFQIDRWLHTSLNLISIEIHGFADASERAYGAVLYVRSTYDDGHVSVKLLTSKSRVSPLKTISLPRLELCAAVLLAELTQSVQSIINFKVDEYYFWSDSMIVLHWIRSDPSRWKVFVAHRVADIQKLTSTKNWSHVSSTDNPADLVSRGLSPDIFVHSSLPAVENEDIINSIKYSGKFNSLKRVVAYLLRMTPKSKARRVQPISSDQKCLNVESQLTNTELDYALFVIVRVVKKISFPEEYHILQRGKHFVKSGVLKSLSPFMDENGVIRVGGRLQHSTLPYESKHPMLLPFHHNFPVTLAFYFHRKFHHAGPQALLAAIRGEFWPLNGRKLCTKIFKGCYTCFRVRPTASGQKMGNLPVDRVNPAPPFAKTAVDYCGPFFHHYRQRGKPPTKTYLCVFICTVTKAIHLELASDLSTAAFMGALRRFVATRGIPQRIHSDNGTNFVGANSLLNELYHTLSSISLMDELKDYCRGQHIDWSFIPPMSPHFGGLHESGVKLAKFHLRRTIGTAKLTFEQLSTLMKEVEAILNSRPLTPVTSSPDDLQCLTPGHFLIGRPLTSIMSVPLSEKPPIDTWKQLEFFKVTFWKRWSTEHLRAQQQRYQWTLPSKNVEVGDMVILIDDNLPPLYWRLGRITQTFPGDDGLVRVVLVRTSKGEFKRAVHRICKLPILETDATFQGGDHDESS